MGFESNEPYVIVDDGVAEGVTMYVEHAPPTVVFSITSGQRPEPHMLRPFTDEERARAAAAERQGHRR